MIRRILLFTIFICLITLGSFGFAARTRVALAADPGDVTVNVTLQRSTAADGVADQLNLELRQGSTALDSTQLTQASQTSQTTTFTPVTFSSIAAGNYQACIGQTNDCQIVVKTAAAPATASLKTGLSAADAAAISGTNPSTNPTDANAKNPQNCESDAGPLGWLMCPILEGVQRSVSWIETKVIVPFLQTQPLAVTSSNGKPSPMYAIWSVMRDAADALLVIVFLVVIFGQTFGLDAYTIKKSLPRIVAAAILIQLSFVIASFGVDVANILGSGIKGLIDNTLNATGIVSVHFTLFDQGIGLTAILVGGLAAGAAVLSLGVFLLALGALFGVLAVFLTLIARQIIITLLIVTAPLAFLLWVLPNTQNLFKFWQKNFVRLLLMYPLIVLLFASSKIVAVIATASNGTNSINSQVSAIVALVAAIVPLFLVPATFKFSGSLLTMADGWSKKASGFFKDKYENSAQYEQWKTTSDNRRKSLTGGAGVTFRPGGPMHLRGSSGQLIGGNVLAFGKAGQTKALKGLKDIEKRAGEEFKDLGLSPDGSKMALRGKVEAGNMITDQKKEVERLTSMKARGAAGFSQNELDMALYKLEDLKAQERLARRYYGNTAAQIAAFNTLGEQGMLDGDDIKILQSRAAATGTLGASYANLVWDQNKFKFRDADPVLAATTLSGLVNIKDVTSNLGSRPPEKMKLITKDGMEAIAGAGLMGKIKPETLIEIMRVDSPNRVGDKQIEIIRKFQEAEGSLTKSAADQLTWARDAIARDDLLKDKGLLGGLIGSESSNTPPERNLRRIVHVQLEGISTIDQWARDIERKPLEDLNKKDYYDFEKYRQEWLGRVDGRTGEMRDI